MANRPSFHKSEKRKKELARLKKKEEKKLRRLNKGDAAGQEDPVIPDQPTPGEGSEDH
jgi:hypothetical protein